MKRNFLIRQSNVYVRCKYRTAFKKFTTDQLEAVLTDNNDYHRSFAPATHIVSKIQYGSDTTFTLTKNLKKTENEVEETSRLIICARNLLKILSGSEDADGSTSKTDGGNEMDIPCFFESDLQLSTNVKIPYTYREAIEFARNFTQTLSDSISKDPSSGNTKPLGVPITVWLHPLELTQYDAPILCYEISPPLVSECVQLVQGYKEVEKKVNNVLAISKNPFRWKLIGFYEYVTPFLTELRMTLGQMLVDIRCGKISIDSIRDLLNRINNEKSTSNPNHLKHLLDQKQKEVCAIKMFQDQVENRIGNRYYIQFFDSPRDRSSDHLSSSNVRFCFELVFRSLISSEPFISLLWLLDKETKNEIAPIEQCWWEDKNVVEKIEKEISIFVKLSKYENHAFTFSVTFDENDGSDLEFESFFFTTHRGMTQRGVNNALLFLCQYYDKENLIDIIRLLLDQNIDVNSINNEGENALHFVCGNYRKDNSIDIIKLLLDRGIDVNRKTNQRSTALTLLCKCYQNDRLIDIIRLLVGKGIDVNGKDNDGDNALILLCELYQKENAIDVTQLLLDNKIDVNCKNNKGWNALHCVCRFQPRNNLNSLVKLLIQNKIDANLLTTGSEIGTARSFLLGRFKVEEIKDVIKILDSNT